MKTARIPWLFTTAALVLVLCLAQGVWARTLTTSAGPGGCVWEPGQGTFEYDDGEEVGVIAVPSDGFQFAGWTGTAVQAGKVPDPEDPSITLVMDGNYSLIASFETAGGPLEYKLTVVAGEGGYVSQPGEGMFDFEVIKNVPIVAHAYTGFQFSGWTGSAVTSGKVADPASESTTVTVDGVYRLRANFVRFGKFSVQVLAPNGGEVLMSGSTFPIRWQTEGEIASLAIDLTIDGGATWTHVGTPNASDGSYDWRVPKIVADRCLIRIHVLDNAAIVDVSDAFFSIRKPTGHIWYVDAAAAPGGDGTSWETAFVCLQDALAGAAENDSVWVAQGMYWPDLGAAQTAGSRWASFLLKNGVAVCGGFPTGGGTWDQRNPFLQQSILSGNLGDQSKNSDNSYHVVTGSGTNGTAILDGFVITGGCANGGKTLNQGAGLFVQYGSPQLRNCILVGNVAAGHGGGACCLESSATFTNCVFNSNAAGDCGGGLYHEQGSVSVTNCTFAANEGLWRGGGVFNASGTAVVTNGILWGNGRMSGWMYDEVAQVGGDVKPVVAYCCIQGWSGSFGGEGSFGQDPRFADADGPDNVAGTPDDDLRVQAGSRCIEGGDRMAVPPEVTTDQQGDPRIQGRTVDLGAYEFRATP